MSVGFVAKVCREFFWNLESCNVLVHLWGLFLATLDRQCRGQGRRLLAQIRQSLLDWAMAGHRAWVCVCVCVCVFSSCFSFLTVSLHARSVSQNRRAIPKWIWKKSLRKICESLATLGIGFPNVVTCLRQRSSQVSINGILEYWKFATSDSIHSFRAVPWGWNSDRLTLFEIRF